MNHFLKTKYQNDVHKIDDVFLKNKNSFDITNIILHLFGDKKYATERFLENFRLFH
jgi:hypothetical protein